MYRGRSRPRAVAFDLLTTSLPLLDLGHQVRPLNIPKLNLDLSFALLLLFLLARSTQV
jgi:hypothetical protein